MTSIVDSVLVLGWIEYKIPLHPDYSTKKDRGQIYFIGCYIETVRNFKLDCPDETKNYGRSTIMIDSFNGSI